MQEGGFMNKGNYQHQASGLKGEGHDRAQETTTPMLISWLKNAATKSQDDVVLVDKMPLDKVKIIGRVIRHESKGTKTMIRIEDSSGWIELSCNKKYDEEMPKVLRNIDLDKFPNQARPLPKSHPRDQLLRRQALLHCHSVQPDYQP